MKLVMKWRLLVLLLPLLTLLASTPATAQRTTLLVGAFNNYPFVYPDATGQWVGFDFDFFQAIGDKAGLTFDYEVTNFAQLIPNLATRYYDVAVGCIVPTADRRALVNFTDPYFVYQFILVAPQFSSIRGVADLTFDRTVSVLRGGIPERLARTLTTAQVLPADSFALGLEAVIQGDAQATIVSDVVFTEFQRTHPAAQLKVIGEPVAYFECGAAVNKNDLLLLATLNKTMATLRDDGSFTQLYRRWFDERPIMLTAPVSATVPITQSTVTPPPASPSPVASQRNENQPGATIYYLTHQSDPATYEIVTLTPDGVWISSRYGPLTGTPPLPSLTNAYGAWAAVNNQIQATVLTLGTESSSGAVTNYAYQMSVDGTGQVTGSYQVSAYPSGAPAPLATATSPSTVTVSFTGQRLTIAGEQ